MAQQRGRSQARRNNGNSNNGGMPGWAWLVLGMLLALVLMLAVPRFLKPGGEGGFFRPKPNPDARAEASTAPEEVAAEPSTAAPAKPAAAEHPEYSFYDVLPKEEVRLSDAQLAAMAKDEARRKAEAAKAAASKPAGEPGALPQPIDAATQVAKAEAPKPATVEAPKPAAAPVPAQPEPTAPKPATTSVAKAEPPATPAPANVTVAHVRTAEGVNVPIAKTVPATAQTPYLLQAGAYGDAGQAEAIKAKIALLGLNARVESADVGGKTVYRVRMGPYATASELAEAKGRLSSGGLSAMAVRAK